MEVTVGLYDMKRAQYTVLDAWMLALNVADQQRAAAFHYPVDKYRFLAARWLLQNWLAENKLLQQIASIATDEYKRPVLEGVSFSISHSGDWVGLAAIAGHGKIGLDIEENKSLVVKDYMLPFTAAEQEYILQEDSIKRFYHLWTRKEAALKAMGKGFLSEPTLTHVLADNILVDGKELYLHQLDACDGYTIHIATEIADINRLEIVVKN
jgi:4'-phosphopantetheinyl transferase